MFLAMSTLRDAEPFTMNGTEIAQLVDFVSAHRWWAVSSLVIGILVRLVKSDTKIPLDLPGDRRAYLAALLGVVSGVVDAIATGKPWVPALFEGLASAVTAMGSHDFFIGAIRKGRELPIPGLIKPGARPSADKPITVHPPAMDPVASAKQPAFLSPDDVDTLPPPPDTDTRKDTTP